VRKRNSLKQYKIGIVVGRFQPFHLGHKYLIERALEICENIIIGIGSSNISDAKNPYSYLKRKRFVQEFINDEGISPRVVKIVAVSDYPDDSVWFSQLIKTTGKIDVSIGDNEWVNGIFENENIPIVRIGYFKRRTLEGTKIRKLIIEKGQWEDKVPASIKALIKK
jgi:nicotinamide-nucleotide adenylyltransferase